MVTSNYVKVEQENGYLSTLFHFYLQQQIVPHSNRCLFLSTASLLLSFFTTDRKEYYHLFLTWEDSGDESFYFQQVILRLHDWERSVIKTKNEANERIINFGLQPPRSTVPFMDANASRWNCCRTNFNKTWTNEAPEKEELFRTATCLNVHKQSQDGILETMIASDRRPGSGGRNQRGRQRGC